MVKCFVGFINRKTSTLHCTRFNSHEDSDGSAGTNLYSHVLNHCKPYGMEARRLQNTRAICFVKNFWHFFCNGRALI